MKLSKIKITAFILIIIMLSSFVLSCGEKGGTETNNTVTSNENNSSTTDSANDAAKDETPDAADAKSSIEARPDYALPDIDMEGYNFRIISRSEAINAHWYNWDIVAEADTGDPLNDAIYARTRAVEDRYNITITNIPDNDAGF